MIFTAEFIHATDKEIFLETVFGARVVCDTGLCQKATVFQTNGKNRPVFLDDFTRPYLGRGSSLEIQKNSLPFIKEGDGRVYTVRRKDEDPSLASSTGKLRER